MKKKEVDTKELIDQVVDEAIENAEAADVSETTEETKEDAEEKSKKPRTKRSTKKTEEQAEEVKAEDIKDEEAAEPAVEKKKRKNNVLRERKRAIDKNLSEDEFIMAATSRDTFSGEIASKERRRELAKEPKIITEDGEREAPTPQTIYDEEYKDLRASAKNNIILSGEIIGVRQTDADNPTSMVLADVRYKTGAFKVSIPAALLFYYDEKNYEGIEGTKDLIESIKKRIGSTVKFVAAYVKQDEGICYADRLRAMSLIGSRHYLKDWGRTGEPHLYPGLIGEGRIMAVGYQYVIADVLGAEIRIPSDELSYLHIGDARNTFSVDQPVTVFITEVTEKNVVRGRNKYTLVAAKGSIKKCFPNERQKYYNEFSVGMLTSAKITHIDEDLHVFVTLNGGKMDAICPYPSGNPKPMVGQKRVVRITMMDDETLRIFGMFVKN